MLHKLPATPEQLLAWTWPDIEPYYRELLARPLAAVNLEEWLADWSRVSEHVNELMQRLAVATIVNTADRQAEERRKNFLENVYFAGAVPAEQKLKQKLLASGLEPQGFAVPLRNMRAEAQLFREANLPLLAAEQKLNVEYDKLIAAQTIAWEGSELTPSQLRRTFQNPDRNHRERAWHALAQRQLADREAINQLWQRYLPLRLKIAANADLPDYRAYAWQQRLRFDYVPDDCKAFHSAIEAVVVPAASRIYERRRQQLGLDQLRPWDLTDGWYGLPIGAASRPPLRPYKDNAELTAKISTVFHKVDPQLGRYFEIMLAEGLADLENRKNKAPGAQCLSFAARRRPFIVCNAVGTHDDVQTTLHESGHAFHVFEVARLPYFQQADVPLEFAEVASMGMELLAAPYLTEFYAEAEAARARVEHLEEAILFWPFMAVVDGFQHWVYEHPVAGNDPAQCDAQWSALWDRFIPKVDWSGLDEVKATGWHRKLHIHLYPFYYTEYGMAQLGAVQIWGHALRDQPQAVADYRRALALGGTVTLPEMFSAAGAKFAFDAPMLQKAVGLMESMIETLSPPA
jgi:oligoendopeptidase F